MVVVWFCGLYDVCCCCLDDCFVDWLRCCLFGCCWWFWWFLLLLVLLWCAVLFVSDYLLLWLLWFCRCLWVCLFVILFVWVVSCLLVLVAMISWCLLMIGVYLLMLWLYYVCVCALFGGLNLLVCFVCVYGAFADYFIAVFEDDFGNSVVFLLFFVIWCLAFGVGCLIGWIVVDFDWLYWCLWYVFDLHLFLGWLAASYSVYLAE